MAISLGGDGTLSTITGSIAEVIYPVPVDLHSKAVSKLDYEFKSELAGDIDYLFGVD